MTTIGQQLRSGREDKGASRVDVSQETKIAVHHLAALEYSDFKELPDIVHVKGYVRAYAEYLGLEPAAVLEQFLLEYEAQFPSVTEDPRDETVREMSKIYGGSQRDWFRRLRPVWIVGALALAALLVWFGWGRSGDGGDTNAVTTVLDPAGPSDAAVTIPADARAEPEPTTTGAPAAEVAAETQEPKPQQYVVFREPGQETAAPSKPVETAEPVAEPRPSQAPVPVSRSRLGVTQHGVGTGVENRQLRGEADRFPEGTKIAFFTRVEGGRAGDSIRHVWRHEGTEIASIPLRIGSANWRTYSVKTMHAGSDGAWSVEAVDEAGNVLARSEFVCAP